MSTLPRVATFGRLRIVNPDGSERPVPRGHARELVAILAARGPTAAYVLASMLWPADPEEIGMVRLRNVLARLRRACGPIVARDGALLHLTIQTDLDAVRRGAPVPRHAGELLAEWPFNEWAEEARRELAFGEPSPTPVRANHPIR